MAGFKIAEGYVEVVAKSDRAGIRQAANAASNEFGRSFDRQSQGFKKQGLMAGTNFASGLSSGASSLGSAFASMAGMATGAAMAAALSNGAFLAAAAGAIALASSLGFAAAAFVAIIPAALAAISAIGTIGLAMSGVSKALKAYGAQRDSVAGGGGKAAKMEVDNSKQIRAAQEQLTDARKAQSRAARDAAENIKDAEERLADAQRNAAEAQRDLNDARQEAADNIEEMSRKVRGAVLDEEEAKVRLMRAELNVQQTQNDPKFSPQQQAEAIAELNRAQDDLSNAVKDRAKTEKDAQKAVKDGVEGSKIVLDAKAREVDALDNVHDAEENLARTKVHSAEMQQDAAIRVSRAMQALVDAHKSVGSSAGAAGGGINQFGRAMSNLTPAGRAFVNQVIRMQKLLDVLKRTAETTFLPGLTYMLQKSEVLFPIVNKHVGNMGTILGNAAKALGDFIATPGFGMQLSNIFDSIEKSTGNATKAVVPFFAILTTLTEAAGPLLERATSAFADFMIKLNNFIQLKKSTGELQSFFKRAGDELAKWFRIFGNIGRGVFAVLKAALPTGMQMSSAIESISEKFKKWAESADGQQQIKDFFNFLKNIDVEKLFQIAAAATAIGLALKGISAASGVVGIFSSLAAMGPVGIALAVVAAVLVLLAGAFTILYTKSESFRTAVGNAFKVVTENVIPAIKDLYNWWKDKILPIIQEAITKIGTALKDAFNKVKEAIMNNKDELIKIWNAFKTVYEFLAKYIYPILATVASFLIKVFAASISNVINVVGFFVRRVEDVVNALGWLKNKATEVKDWLVARFNDVVNFMRGLPGRISSATSGMWDGIKSAFKHAINWVIEKWNNLSFPAISVGGVQLTPSIGTPNIGYLAKGGPAQAGGAYVVGEKGPELLQMGSTSGRVIPNNKLNTGTSGNTYIFQDGAITLDAHNVKDFQDIIDMVNNLRPTARQFGFRTA